jgi:signal transduction histidine kinase
MPAAVQGRERHRLSTWTVERHGGTVQVESSEAAGITYTLHLPCA